MKEVLSLKHAILATLHYFDLFDFPLTVAELEEYLYGWSAPSEAISDVIQHMHEIGHGHGFYFLKGRDGIAELRKERMKIADDLWKKIERSRFLLSACPFVKMAAVCNTLAYGNVTQSSDIDLFVITKDEKLATARFFMKLFTQLFRMRAHHEKIARRFCLSFFVTESVLNLKPLAHDFDPHLAYFVNMMTPLFGEAAYKDWLNANDPWVSFYFKRQIAPRLSRIKNSPVATVLKFLFECFLRLFGKGLENFLYEFQMKRDRARQKQFPKSRPSRSEAERSSTLTRPKGATLGIVMNRNIFKFHESDPREEIAKQFLERLKAI